MGTSRGPTGQELKLRPTHAPVKAYYEALRNFKQLGAQHEGAVRDAFQDLLKKCAGQFDWTLVPEHSYKTRDGRSVTPDGALLDSFRLHHGWWEAKDDEDDLKDEVKKKLEKGYPRDNILFQAPERAVLYQNGVQVRDAELSDPEQLTGVLRLFFEWKKPEIEEFQQAVEEFKDRIPELAKAVLAIIEKERKGNRRFVEAFDAFAGLCRQSINPNLSDQAVEEMPVEAKEAVAGVN